MYVQFIIFAFMMNSLLTNFYNNNAIIYVQHSPKLFYIKTLQYYPYIAHATY